MKLEERCSCGAEFRVEADGYRELQTFTSSTRESLPDLAIGLERLDAWQTRHRYCGEAGTPERPLEMSAGGYLDPQGNAVTLEQAKAALAKEARPPSYPAPEPDLVEAERQKALLERERGFPETLKEHLARLDRQKAKPR